MDWPSHRLLQYRHVVFKFVVRRKIKRPLSKEFASQERQVTGSGPRRGLASTRLTLSAPTRSRKSSTDWPGNSGTTSVMFRTIRSISSFFRTRSMSRIIACAANIAKHNRWISASVRGHSRRSMALIASSTTSLLGDFSHLSAPITKRFHCFGVTLMFFCIDWTIGFWPILLKFITLIGLQSG